MIRPNDLHFRAIRLYKKALFRGDLAAANAWLELIDRQRAMLGTEIGVRKMHHARKSLRNNRTFGGFPGTQRYDHRAHLAGGKISPPPCPACGQAAPRTPPARKKS